MRYLILFCVSLVVTVPAFAQEAPAPVRAILDYCLPALMNGVAPAAMAEAANLPLFPPEQAIKFAPDGGMVFALPDAPGQAVFITNKNYKAMCGVAVHETDKAKFWAAIDQWFGPKTPFRLLREKRMDREKVTRREYEADIGGPIAFIVSVSDTPREGGMQALMTAARVKKKQP